MSWNISYILVIIVWVLTFNYMEQRHAIQIKELPDFEYRYSYHHHKIKSGTVTIVDKDGDITICTVGEGSIVVCI